MKCTIRRLDVADLISYKSIRLEAVRTERTAFGGSYEDEVQRPDSFYENKLSKDWATEHSAVFGAFEENYNLIGIIGLFSRDGRKLSHKAILWGMYVRGAYRKMGVGKQLVCATIEFAKTMGAEFIELTVVDDNKAAVRFYESVGFQCWGREPAALKLDGKYFVENHMSFKIG